MTWLPVRQTKGNVAETTNIAEHLSGDKLYQERAREALPLLVRQAQAQSKILYSELALELGMPNPRNLNYVLGYIGQALESLSSGWEEEIPPLQCLVVNKQTGLPGEGIGWFVVKKEDFRKLPRKQQRETLQIELQKVFVYQKWLAVLEAFGLSAKPVEYADLLRRAAESRGGGESEQHRRLKEYVAKHPRDLELPAAAGVGEIEFSLPSGDSLDVLFRVGEDWSAVEVKSAISDTSDIVRGLFQCVKYRAVIEGYQATRNLPQSVRTVLVLEGAFPAELTEMKHMLGIEVVDHVRLRSKG